jgi:predicted ATPase
MLREISATGFKSLSGFHMEIHPGLNVLVGPNGSGKTNIIRLIDFLSFLQQYSLSEAISKSGGAGEIFRKIEDLKIDRQIKIRVRGSGNQVEALWEPQPKSVHYAYELDFEIEFAESDNTLKFSSQAFRAKEYRQVPKSPVQFNSVAWDVTMSNIAPSKEVTLVHRAGYKLDERLKRYFERYRQLAKEDAGIHEYLLTTYLSRYFPFFEKFAQDVSLGNTYNIVPSRVREPEDIAQIPTVNFDGSGLAATLYHLKHATEHYGPLGSRHYRRRSFTEETFRKVQSYFSLVNPNLSDVEVTNDPYENKLKVSALVRTGSNEVRMPLNLLSDGTIKWLALITALSTSVSYFSIEEPENYIHPKMQQEFAQIVRETCEQNEEMFALITTHSETLLNAMKPHEIVIVSMQDGRTVAKSILDPELIAAEINRTGFGLGYYYVTDAVNA